ncbi:MAG: histone deacetylase [Gammaproteobacteria bacterium]|nr:histone deacetylase [Gammaproteobacteria bacterium]
MSKQTLPLVFHPIYSQLKLAKNHRFPIEKYKALQQAAMTKYGDLLSFYTPTYPVTETQLSTAHDNKYIQSFIDGSITEKAMKRIGFPWSEQFVDRTRLAVAGTIKTGHLAIKHDIAINCTGGYHHAHPDFGSGFCVFNDLVLTAKELISEGKANRVLIFDCDVHQGDGTATTAQADNDIFTLSIHCEKNFPVRKQQSDWDIGLEKHLNDESYLEQVKNALNTVMTSFRPDFIIYDAGVDIHENDDLGLLNISTNGVYQRDKFVFAQAKTFNVPIMAVIGGGYQRDIAALTEVHMQLINAAVDTFIV